MPSLTDRQRVELAVPARLIFGLAVSDCFAPEPDLTPEQLAEGQAQVARLRAHLVTACVEPIVDLAPRLQGKLARRIERTVEEIGRYFDGQDNLKVALCLYYFLADLLEREILVLFEGSAMAEAMALLLPMMEHGFGRERLDASAQKQARRLLARLQAAGLYGAA